MRAERLLRRPFDRNDFPDISAYRERENTDKSDSADYLETSIYVLGPRECRGVRAVSRLSVARPLGE